MGFEQIRRRLHSGRPLVMDGDSRAAFEARGVLLDSPGALGRLLRQHPETVLEHYRVEVHSRVDILSALTADTTPRSLVEVGMQHRAALLTGLAVELAQQAAAEADKAVGIAGVLGSEMVNPTTSDRLFEELREHAARLAAAGCELLIVRGQGSRIGLMAAVVAARATELPTLAVVESDEHGELCFGGSVGDLIEGLSDAGACAVLFEVPSARQAVGLLDRARSYTATRSAVPGVLLSGSRNSVRGYADPESDPRYWVDGALELSQAGARLLGGGAGTTESHTQALAIALGELHPSTLSPS